MKRTRMRSYLVLAENKDTGEIVGYCEESFSMGYYQNRAQLSKPYLRKHQMQSEYAIKQAYKEHVEYLQKTVRDLNERNEKYRHFYVRAGSKNCPVKVDWNTWYEIRHKSKFDFRNVPFVIK